MQSHCIGWIWFRYCLLPIATEHEARAYELPDTTKAKALLGSGASVVNASFDSVCVCACVFECVCVCLFCVLKMKVEAETTRVRFAFGLGLGSTRVD